MQPRDTRVVSVATPADLEAALPELLTAPALGLDTETTGLDPRRDRLRLVQLATGDRVYIVDCSSVDPRTLAPVLASCPRLIGHNLAFDLAFLAAAGLEVAALRPGAVARERLFDTMLAARLLAPRGADGRRARCDLAAVVERYLGETLEKTEQCSDWTGELSQEQLEYAAKDAAVLLPLAVRLEAELADVRHLTPSQVSAAVTAEAAERVVREGEQRLSQRLTELDRKLPRSCL